LNTFFLLNYNIIDKYFLLQLSPCKYKLSCIGVDPVIKFISHTCKWGVSQTYYDDHYWGVGQC